MRKGPIAVVVFCLVAALTLYLATGTLRSNNSEDFADDPAYAEFYDQELEWSDSACAGSPVMDLASEPFECAHVTVPKNWHDPTADSIYVAIARPLGSEGTDKRLLLGVTSEAGSHNLAFAPYYAEHSGLDHSHYAVGVDPRGVGASSRLRCPQEVQLSEQTHLGDGDPRTYDDASIAATSQAYAEKTQACARANEGWMEFVNTEQTARDFNLIRHVLGYNTADYYGFSYGTWLGSVMERMFPDNFDRVVLGANVDWNSGSLLDVHQSRAASVQHVADQQFYPFLARQHSTFGLGTTPMEVSETVANIRSQVAEGALGDDISPGDIDRMIYASFYAYPPFDAAAEQLAGLHKRLSDPESEAPDFVVMGDENLLRGVSQDVFDTVTCADTAISDDPLYYAKKNADIAETMPTWGPMTLHNPCAGWEFEPALDAEFFDSPVGQVLMVQAEGDPIAGYAGAVAAKESVDGDVRMVVADDFAGNGILEWVNPCVGEVVTNYLRDGIFPEHDVNCQAAPLPGQGTKEDEVYELGNPGTEPDQIPEPVEYRERDLSAPPADTSRED